MGRLSMGLVLCHTEYKMVGGIILEHSIVVYIFFDSSLRLGMGKVWREGRYHDKSNTNILIIRVFIN